MKPRKGDVCYSPVLDQLRIIREKAARGTRVEFAAGVFAIPALYIEKFWVKVGRL